MIAPARVAAYDALLALTSGRLDLPSAIAVTRETLSDDRDRALAAELITGVQRWRARLDHVITRISKRDLHRLDPEVVEILRLGVYQLLHLTRVPAAAAVNDAVSLCGRARKKSASGLVNAVLRSISRQRSALPIPSRPVDTADRDAALDYLSCALSHPRWLAERWLDRLGFDRAEAWMLFNNQPAPLTLRANTRLHRLGEIVDALATHEILVQSGRWAAEALIVTEGRPLHDPGVQSGLFVVQDEASQLVAALAGEHPLAPVLDTCASPGGKATMLAAAVSGEGLVVACDVRAKRVELLARTVQQTGTTNVRIVHADATALPFLPSTRFATVLVDAPCSGLGTLRRDPDIKWRRTADELPRLATAQRQMLTHAAAAVAPGGRLIYATCSTEPEENDEVARAFLEATPTFARIAPGRINPALDRSLFGEDGFFRTEPDRHGLEGFFAAVFERAQTL
ncbi:MAG: 16S rRNA (cytosine(967)-C(5))-methyltransferase RsmB [Acidobacteriaceae bacterium]|jgi:16S rRNA (cytosine967-C5)-methyltransferase|nr:16S rRNA (cytosine(967)-C(5))-methyltransferase RsmB [Acidobacteriaceae bacterium]